MTEPTENPFPGPRATSTPNGVTCAQCGVPWSLDVRDKPCPMAPRGDARDYTMRHLFAQGVTAPEVERLRAIERAATALVAESRSYCGRDGSYDEDSVFGQPIADLRAALESK